MLGKKLFDELSNTLGETLEKSPVKDVEKNIKAVLGSAFSRMDLVTREEFDIQQQVLLKTREKLAALEARVAELESCLNGKNTLQAADVVDTEPEAAPADAAPAQD